MTSIIEVLRSVKVFLSRRADCRSRWRFVCNEYLASTLSIHFCAVQPWKGLLQIVVNVKLNKYHCFGKCNSSLIPGVPILGFCLLRFVVMKKSCCSHSIFHGVVQQENLSFFFCIISSFNSSTTL